MTGDTGVLFIDGEKPTLEQTRWFPYQILRKSVAENLGIETATRMIYEQRGLLFHIAVTNTGTEPRTFELKIILSVRHIAPPVIGAGKFHAIKMPPPVFPNQGDERKPVASAPQFQQSTVELL